MCYRGIGGQKNAPLSPELVRKYRHEIHNTAPQS